MTTPVTIKLSPETLSILKTASLINNSIQIEKGDVIKTLNNFGSIIMEAKIPDTFPETFSIYELNRLLSVLNLPNMKEAELTFSGTNHVVIKSGQYEVTYRFTAKTFTTHSGGSIQLPSEDLKVNVTSDDMSNLGKMAAVLGHKVMEFSCLAGKIFLGSTDPALNDGSDPAGSSSNDTSILLAESPTTADGVYRIKFENVILPAGDYEVTISKAGVALFKHLSKEIKVHIGLERA